ncbi:MAG: hypothetical protein FWD73_00875 [Polyangiaceae bacterium]|nr:hypothetical protein [Polyangiaceae bacterium]
MNLAFSRTLGRYALAVLVSTTLACSACSSSNSTSGNGSTTTTSGGDGGGTNSGSGNGTNLAPSQNIDAKLVGSWYLGNVSGSYYDSSGAYTGVSGAGSIDAFNADGTFVRVVVSTLSYVKTEMYLNGKYSVSGDTVQVYDSTYEIRHGGNVTEGGPHADISFQYRVGSDDQGDYLMESTDNSPITDDSAKARRVE